MKNPIFWDYKFTKNNISNPKTKLWYLNRKLSFGDFEGIKKTDLKDNLTKLKIDPNLKKMILSYLKSNA